MISKNQPATSSVANAKRVLIAFTNVGVMTAALMPDMLHRAGCHVTMMGKASRRISVSWHYDKWIATPEDATEIIKTITQILERDPSAFDWVILCDDLLLRAVQDLELPTAIAARLCAIRNAEALETLGSKTATAAFLDAKGIRVPPFKICKNTDEIPAAAEALGFPVMVKLDRSQNASGVFPCKNSGDIALNTEKYTGDKFQVEKFVEGEQIGVEPLYIDGKLLAYISGKIIKTDRVTGLETWRRSYDDPAFIPILKHLGECLRLNGFCNLGFIKSKADGTYYLFEADFRPNAWISADEHYGVDFATALKRYWNNPTDEIKLQTPQSGQDVRIFNREIEQYIRERNGPALGAWLKNTGNCWRFLPSDNPGFVVRTLLRLIFAPTIKGIKQKLFPKNKEVIIEKMAPLPHEIQHI